MRFGVDVGGTFTDVVGVDQGGGVQVEKVRSLPGDIPRELWAAIASARESRVQEDASSLLIHGTTVATNALIQRAGGRVVLLATAGFEDLLWLRRQDRADLYDLSQHHPDPLVARENVVPVTERVSSGGVIEPLTEACIEKVVVEVGAREPDAIAIALLFGFMYPEHEILLAKALRSSFPDTPVAASHEVLPVFREYERTSTTVAEAYLRPCVSPYLSKLEEAALQNDVQTVMVMASNGGTLSVRQAGRRSASLALSGPAGGVEGARLIGELVGFRDLLTLDMGGTSADASIVLDGSPEVESSGVLAGLSLALPRILIETVGAGGGSIAWVDSGGALRVGPQSAGAVPGPACYAQGGEDPTVTDAALLLGWLDPERPLASDLELDVKLARKAVANVERKIGLSIERCAAGIIEVVTTTMVRALRRVSVERGIDPRGLSLMVFGGAGPLFVCRLAERLGMTRAIIPPHAGVLSALGLVSAPQRVEFSTPCHQTAGEVGEAEFSSLYEFLASEALGELPDADVVRLADCRYPGQGYEITVPVRGDGSQLAQEFHQAHRQRYGHSDESRAVEIVNARLVASVRGTSLDLSSSEHTTKRKITAERFMLDDLEPGSTFEGPVTLDGKGCTARVEESWIGSTHSSGAVLLERR